jgi:ATP-dependent DNA helicase RecG
MYLTGDIERYGTGTVEIFHLLEEAHLSRPQFNLEEGFKVIPFRPLSQTAPDNIPDTIHDTAHDSQFFLIEDLKERLVLIVVGDMSRDEIMFKPDLRHRQHFQKNYIEPSMKEKLIEMTLPDKPTSKNQKYRLTKKGITLQKKLKA